MSVERTTTPAVVVVVVVVGRYSVTHDADIYQQPASSTPRLCGPSTSWSSSLAAYVVWNNAQTMRRRIVTSLPVHVRRTTDKLIFRAVVNAGADYKFHQLLTYLLTC